MIILIDYENKTCKLKQIRTIDRFMLLEKDGSEKHKHSFEDQPIMFKNEDKLVIVCHIRCKYNQNTAYYMTYLYQIEIDKLLAGSNRFEIVDIETATNGSEMTGVNIRDYLINNFSNVKYMYYNYAERKLIYMFYADKFYEYKGICLCCNRYSCFLSGNCNEITNISPNLIVFKHKEKQLIILPNQDNHINVSKEGYELVECIILSKNIVYLKWSSYNYSESEDEDGYEEDCYEIRYLV